MKFLFLPAALIAFSLANAQEPAIPPEAKPFIPEGFEVLDYQVGDLNADKKPDAIMILKKPGEDTVMDEELSRPMLILIRQADDKLKQVLRNDSAILCRHCGGVMGDPYEGINVENNGFMLSYYGGSSWRWATTYWFAWKPQKQTWCLVKQYETGFHMTDPNHPTKDATIEETELGVLTLEKFNSEPIYEDTPWKVTAAKTFFYNNPKLGIAPRKAYLLKGNKVTGIRQLTNFIEISFENDKGKFISGYILRKDLEPVK